ncbi:unnamed protein product [Chrysoparadoxa australica]
MAALKQQVEFYFSRQNLQNDAFLVRQMDASLSVPISVIANFGKIKALTSDEQLIAESVKESTVCSVNGNSIRANIKSERNTIILREIPSDIPMEQVEAVFTGEGIAPVKSIRSDVGDTWFVTCSSEADAMQTILALRNKTLLGRAIKARLKSESTLRSFLPPPQGNSLPGAAGRGSAGGMLSPSPTGSGGAMGGGFPVHQIGMGGMPNHGMGGMPGYVMPGRGGPGSGSGPSPLGGAMLHQGIPPHVPVGMGMNGQMQPPYGFHAGANNAQGSIKGSGAGRGGAFRGRSNVPVPVPVIPGGIMIGGYGPQSPGQGQQQHDGGQAGGRFAAQGRGNSRQTAQHHVGSGSALGGAAAVPGHSSPMSGAAGKVSMSGADEGLGQAQTRKPRGREGDQSGAAGGLSGGNTPVGHAGAAPGQQGSAGAHESFGRLEKGSRVKGSKGAGVGAAGAKGKRPAGQAGGSSSSGSDPYGGSSSGSNKGGSGSGSGGSNGSKGKTRDMLSDVNFPPLPGGEGEAPSAGGAKTAKAAQGAQADGNQTVSSSRADTQRIGHHTSGKKSGPPSPKPSVGAYAAALLKGPSPRQGSNSAAPNSSLPGPTSPAGSPPLAADAPISPSGAAMDGFAATEAGENTVPAQGSRSPKATSPKPNTENSTDQAAPVAVPAAVPSRVPPSRPARGWEKPEVSRAASATTKPAAAMQPASPTATAAAGRAASPVPTGTGSGSGSGPAAVESSPKRANADKHKHTNSTAASDGETLPVALDVTVDVGELPVSSSASSSASVSAPGGVAVKPAPAGAWGGKRSFLDALKSPSSSATTAATESNTAKN